ncbi:MAG: VWA domain-containing protein [Subdoligranulum sp.]|nr:VWA domain-containing protein [Subdoligranulum sp.]
MKTCLLVGLVIECIVLLALAFAKKLTRKVFFGASGVTACLCALAAGISLFAGQAISIEQKDQLYMAARLMQEDRSDSALYVLSMVEDEDCSQFGVEPLRGLSYNLNQAYATAVAYLEEQENAYSRQLYDASLRGMPAENGLVTDITAATIDLLALSEDEIARLEAELKLRYLAAEEEPAEEETEAEPDSLIGQIQNALNEGDTREAYRLVLDAAEKGGVRESVILSEMYVQNYEMRTLAEEDREYDALLQEMTDALAELNKASIAVQSLPYSETVTEEQKAYEQASARYDLAQTELYLESVNRAINYLENVQFNSAEDNIAYQLQMAYLKYRAQREDEAKEHLNRIFAVDTIDTAQWMGLEASLLREAYIVYGDDSTSSDFDVVYNQMMQKLYLNIFYSNQWGFQSFMREYFRELLGGIHVSFVDTTSFPQVKVALSSTEMEITPETIEITDTREKITEFQVESQETVQLSICFVLDVSGSMSGNSIVNAKRAIEDSILSLSDETEVALVSFDNTAQINCSLTTSKYMVTGLLGGLQANGGTNIAAGLEMGNTALMEASGKKVIVLLSDGMDGNTGAIAGVLNTLYSEGVTVYTIGLDGCDETYLKNIADTTEGSFVMATDSTQLVQIYEEIQEYLTRTYYITYQVAEQVSDVRYVRVQSTDSLVQSRKTYQIIDAVTNNEQTLEPQTSNYFEQIGGTGGSM